MNPFGVLLHCSRPDVVHTSMNVKNLPLFLSTNSQSNHQSPKQSLPVRELITPTVGYISLHYTIDALHEMFCYMTILAVWQQ